MIMIHDDVGADLLQFVGQHANINLQRARDKVHLFMATLLFSCPVVLQCAQLDPVVRERLARLFESQLPDELRRDPELALTLAEPCAESKRAYFRAAFVNTYVDNDEELTLAAEADAKCASRKAKQRKQYWRKARAFAASAVREIDEQKQAEGAKDGRVM